MPLRSRQTVRNTNAERWKLVLERGGAGESLPILRSQYEHLPATPQMHNLQVPMRT